MGYSISGIAGWGDRFRTQSVQNNNATLGADFLSSESVVMFAGPAAYSDVNNDQFVPIGLVQNVQISQQKQLQQIYEIGSRKPLFVPGRTVVSGGIARVLFDGPSLMYAMYLGREGHGQVYLNPADKAWTPISAAAASGASTDADAPTALPKSVTSLGGDNPLAADAAAQPNSFFINLASSFFNKPTGLGFILYDMEGQPYGGFYMENCYIQAHTFVVASQQTVLVENVSFRATMLQPLDVTGTNAGGNAKDATVKGL